MDKVLELKNVTKDYGDFKLDNVNLSVTKGAICGFIGQNGAGKTTTISLILDINLFIIADLLTFLVLLIFSLFRKQVVLLF